MLPRLVRPTLLLCCAVMSGAAMAAPLSVPPLSPCLAQHPAGQPAPQDVRKHWRRQCHLLDAEKAEEPYVNEGTPPSDTSALLDQIMMLSRIGMDTPESHQLWLVLPRREGDADGWQPPPSGAPGSIALQVNPLYPSGDSKTPLRQGEARLQAGIPAVPEPSSGAMLLAGLAIVAGYAARRRRTA